MPENQDKTKPITVTAKELPLHCPMPDAPLWARHPRVFLDVTAEGKATWGRSNAVMGVWWCSICLFRRVDQGTSLSVNPGFGRHGGGNAPVSRHDVLPGALPHE